MNNTSLNQHNQTINKSHQEDAEVTVYSWELPCGYDYTAKNADPMDDCVDLSHDIHFTLMNSDPDATRESDADAYRPGAVHFEALHPGEYSLDGGEVHEEQSDQIFWECFGFEENVARSVVVNDHHALQFSLQGGEHIMCHRFHIPHGTQDPHRQVS